MQSVPVWKKVLSVIINLILSFVVFGYLIGWLTGNLSSGGFNLNGAPALLLFAFMIAYFVIFNKFLGGTLGRRLFKIPSGK